MTTFRGDVLFELYGSDGTSPMRMLIRLPQGLDAAEPGLILETSSGAPMILGSLGPSRKWLSVPPDIGPGATLRLVDLARDVQLGEVVLPESSP